ncbi:hypothetical protein FRZ67_19045 [Panacibacter ginsenosidivorans]|uniref:Uncharacterized protein n=1 Tax=Panacibacter ginsenosidivorans TaxID=1813871 RepID=A0A5B8VCV4_9BACT|nr:hypothetical protein [Panacibacter ginsenosidivorans]QEC69300.1 hypothetical protein FRZ67_19045 [Panacibacter ginsenosidivorans]
MIEKISWASYATALLTIVVIYYIVIVLLYYRREFFSIANALRRQSRTITFSNRKDSVQDEEIITTCPFINNVDTDNVKVVSETGDISTQVFDLVEKIKDAILYYVERQYIREEIITGLQLLLKEYHQFRYSTGFNQ